MLCLFGQDSRLSNIERLRGELVEQAGDKKHITVASEVRRVETASEEFALVCKGMWGY